MKTLQKSSKISSNNRFGKILLSSGSAIFLKLVVFLCSFILTKLIIKYYGSEVNGTINSITQFLGIITLLEGGIGGVARAALFKPLANKDNETIKKIITYLESFFKILALSFLLYVVCLAFVFPSIAKSNDYWFSFFLVLILAISSFCEYFFGMSYSILINADQKNYLTNVLSFITTLLTFTFSIVLILNKCSILIVKLVCSCILILKPIFLSIYCKHKYNLSKVKLNKNENLLPQKWSGLGVHIAYYLHRNTDIFLITIFLSLTTVSVYSVYNMIISGVLTIIECLTLGVESALGNMYAKNEIDILKNRFKIFVFYYQFLSTILLSCTMILIIPFVKIYTSNISDANYVNVLFAILFVIAEFFYCLRVPYNNLMVATNSFKKIKNGAYIEAAINITCSIIFIKFFGLIGASLGTICAMVYRLIHYLYFFKNHELSLPVKWFIRNSFASCVILASSIILASFDFLNCSSYLSWIITAIIVVISIVLYSTLIYLIFCRKNMADLVKFLKMKFVRK